MLLNDLLNVIDKNESVKILKDEELKKQVVSLINRDGVISYDDYKQAFNDESQAMNAFIRDAVKNGYELINTHLNDIDDVMEYVGSHYDDYDAYYIGNIKIDGVYYVIEFR